MNMSRTSSFNRGLIHSRDLFLPLATFDVAIEVAGMALLGLLGLFHYHQSLFVILVRLQEIVIVITC